MTVPPRTGTSRRSVLRAAVVAAPATALAPSVLGLAESAVAASVTGAGGVQGARPLRKVAFRGKKRGSCRRSKVRVRGRCEPRRKPRSPKKPPTRPVDPAVAPTQGTGPTAPPNGGVPTAPTGPPAYTGPFTLLPAADRHLVNRFSYGIDPALAATVTAAGGGAAWFEQQLTTAGVSDPATDQLRRWYPSLDRTAPDMWSRQSADIEHGWQVMADYQRYLMLRRIFSTRPVLDVMGEFFENHLHVPISGDAHYLFRTSYGDTIRAHALGRFDDMLVATTTHPAIGMFLNAAVSTKYAPNENLGRELLELHTVGRGSYTEDDVKASARILTGYRIDVWRSWKVEYKPSDHWTGPVRVMGFSDPNADPNGVPVAEAYLRYLARHPATAQRLARKLAVKFVSDDPPQALVDTLARTYLENDTAIVPVLRVLAASAAFIASAGGKVRDPVEDVVATYRALQIRVQPPTSPRRNDSAEAALAWQSAKIGLTPHGWPRPDGAPTDSASWSSASRLVASVDLHMHLSSGWWPSTGVTYRAAADWLPAPSVRFDALVEHLSRLLLHRATPPGLLQACCQVVDVSPETQISASHGVIRWNLGRVLTTVLDSPHHMKR